MRSNPLLHKPPGHRHRVRDESRLTRRGWTQQHLGVHTVSQPEIAAAYALNGWLTVESGWPAVVVLDTTDLVAEPDVDALLWWYERGGSVIAEEIVEHGLHDELVGDVDLYGQRSVTEFLLTDAVTFVWDDVDLELLPAALAGDKEALRAVLLAGYPQRRYLTDFDVDRVVEIRTFQPWLDRIAEGPMGTISGEMEPWAVAAERRGWTVVTFEELESFEPVWSPLYVDPRRHGRERDYHGTSSDILAQAFPALFAAGKLPPADKELYRIASGAMYEGELELDLTENPMPDRSVFTALRRRNPEAPAAFSRILERRFPVPITEWNFDIVPTADDVMIDRDWPAQYGYVAPKGAEVDLAQAFVIESKAGHPCIFVPEEIPAEAVMEMDLTPDPYHALPAFIVDVLGPDGPYELHHTLGKGVALIHLDTYPGMTDQYRVTHFAHLTDRRGRLFYSPVGHHNGGRYELLKEAVREGYRLYRPGALDHYLAESPPED